ncbi:NnrS family protein [Gammaproteobacteria bacterium PRO2]|nr:NnrS family protein [Gammaproteobacteria bacterium]MCE7896116.1 NnrS family protein [Gammaproteobacteria bacterium PRO8]MCL4776629.1 NnrS family protein [Gammaproteobacteria bacterium]MCQ3935250.1 NnrS family protein [Gammaproteobacteria bacterium]MDL1881472.1 NnrS family protein [Gammaproteobacteria bacterium PRO2]
MNQTRSSVFFSYAFRPFFLFAGAYAVLALVLWIAGFHGLRWPGAPAAITSLWHAREMALGFCGAVVAGFLLTAVATWTGRQPLRGLWLMVLVASWLLGRLAAMVGGGLPKPWLAAADLAFPVLLAVLAGREILGGASRRNYGIAAMTWVLAALTLLYHLGEAGVLRGGEQLATSLMVHLLAALIAVVGGRVIPLFTANWLRMRGDSRLPLPQPRLDQAAIGLIVAAGAADGIAPGTALAGVLCIVAGSVNLWRLVGWRGSAILANPLLWSLHLAYACMAAGYLLLGAAALGLPLPRTAVLHLLTVGGVSGMILAMMTRVSLGHTGRPLAVVRPIAFGYALLAVAAVLRSFGPALPGPYMAMIDSAALLWVAAFAIFLVVYTPILTRPRIDQK